MMNCCRGGDNIIEEIEKIYQVITMREEDFSFLSPSIDGKNEQLYYMMDYTKQDKNDCLNFLEENFTFESGEDFSFSEKDLQEDTKEKIHYYHLKQKKKPKAVVFCFHGFGTYSEIENVTNAMVFAKDGFEVFSMDFKDHGKSYEKKLDEKPSCAIKDYQKELIEPGIYFIEKMLKQEENRLKDCPIFIWGESMGGCVIILLYFHLKKIKNKTILPKFKGLLLNSPAIELLEDFNTFVFSLLKVLSLVGPELKVGESLGQLTHFNKYHNLFVESKFTYSGPIKLCSGREIILMGKEIKKRMNEIDCPYILQHGTLDNLINYNGSVKLFQESPKNIDKTFISHKNCLHNINFDWAGKSNAILNKEWLNRRL